MTPFPWTDLLIIAGADHNDIEFGAGSETLAAAERYQTGDLGVVTNCYYFEDRLRSFALIAEAFNLSEKPMNTAAYL